MILQLIISCLIFQIMQPILSSYTNLNSIQVLIQLITQSRSLPTDF